MKKTVVTALILLAAIGGGQASERKYDRRLEAAAISIVASRIGDIRGGFGVDRQPEFVVPAQSVRPVRPAAKPGDWSEGIALVAEPGSTGPQSF